MRRVASVLRGRSWLCASVAAPVLLLAVVYAVTLAPMFHASVVIGFSPGAGAPASEAFVRMLPQYAISATSQSSLRAVEDELALPAGTLRGRVSSELVDDSLQVTFTVTGDDSLVVKAVVKSLADHVVRAVAADEGVSVRVLATSEPQDQAPVRRAVAVAVGLLVAACAGLMAALAAEAVAPRVRVADDLLALGAPVLHRMRSLPRGLHISRGSARAGLDPDGRQLASLVGALASRARSADARAAREPVYFCPVAGRQLRVGPLVERVRVAQSGLSSRGPKVELGPALSQLGVEAPSLDRRMFVLVVPAGARVELVRREMTLGGALGGSLLGFVLVG